MFVRKLDKPTPTINAVVKRGCGPATPYNVTCKKEVLAPYIAETASVKLYNMRVSPDSKGIVTSKAVHTVFIMKVNVNLT